MISSPGGGDTCRVNARETLLTALGEFGWRSEQGPVPVDETTVRALIEAIRPISDPAGTCAMVGGEDGSLVNEFEGLEGFADAWSDWLATFETLELYPEEIRENGDHVVALGRQTGRSAIAGVEITSDAAAVCKLEDDLLVRVEFHLHNPMALRAAGLDPTA